MRYNRKLKAFTLAEVMVLLLTLSILLAAFSPVFTTRFNNYSADVIWQFVTGDDEGNDAYYDVNNKSYTSAAFIGITPGGPGEIGLASADESGNSIYSKLVIRSSDRLNISGLKRQQAQIHFRQGSNESGTFVGALFAGNENFLLGGQYNSLVAAASTFSPAMGNTAYGRLAMTALATGKYNTAIGYNSQSNNAVNNYNTTAGAQATEKHKITGDYNTLIGAKAGNTTSGYYNTVVGNNSATTLSGYYNTLIGNNIATGNGLSGYNNTAAGNYALNKLTSGRGNTAVGYNALSTNESGSYNTAIGINACQKVTGSYKTCIGAYSGASENADGIAINSLDSLFTNSDERIFIGGHPRQYVPGIDDGKKPAAVLEIHNVSGKQTNSMPVPDAGNASVVINGNLIVRGQPYLESPIVRPEQNSTPSGLIGFKLQDLGSKGMLAFAPDDGFKRTLSSCESCRGCRSHAYNDMRFHCICTSNQTNSFASNVNNQGNRYGYRDKAAYNGSYTSQSYDWSSASSTSGFHDECGCRNGQNNVAGPSYKDTSINKTFYMTHSSSGGNKGGGELDAPCAHPRPGRDCSESDSNSWKVSSPGSCCPVLTSDRRLKNVGEKFTAGLAQLKKLSIYNFTFKSDEDETPHVGVIAQDLKLIFPNAVTKNDNGYYEIRWDEMFYAVINSVKDINNRVIKLASNITRDRNRITALKKDNASLNAQLDRLADEVTTLEAKKKK